MRTYLWSHWLKRMKKALAPVADRGRRVPLYLEPLEVRAVPTTYTVTTTNDTNAVNPAVSPLDSGGQISVRSAIEALNTTPGTNDTIIVPAGHYLLTAAGGAGQGTAAALLVTDNVTIQGAGAATTLIDAQQLDRVLHVTTDTSAVVLQGLTLENGSAPTNGGAGLPTGDGGGGGILFEAFDNTHFLTLNNVVLTNNEAQGSANVGRAADGYGGAIYQYGGTIVLNDSTVANNKAYGGASGYGGNGEGGGIFTLFGQLKIQSSTISGNTARGGDSGTNGGGTGEGGGLDDHSFLGGSANLIISDSTITENQALGGASQLGGDGQTGGTGQGGGVFSSTLARVTNSTISFNQANGGTGDAGNGAGNGGGYCDVIPLNASFGSTIIADNSVSGGSGTLGQDVFTNTSFTSLGFNLIGINDQTGKGFANGVNNDKVGGTTFATRIDPLLGPLQNNGGPTLTEALMPGSPAINMGSNTYGDVNGNPLLFDQRGPGFVRTDGTDIGSFQTQPITSQGFPGTFVFPPVTAPTVYPSWAGKVQLLGSGDLTGNINAYTLYVNGLYHELLGRAPDQAGLDGWVFLLDSGTLTRLQVADDVWRSPEHRGLEVDAYYQTFLHRASDPAGRAAWVAGFLAGASETTIAEGFLLSAEYQAAHSSNTDFVNGLYMDVLGRAPDAGAASWIAALNGGLSRAVVAFDFLTSPEADTDLVNLYYAHYLKRAPSPAEQQIWVSLLVTGTYSPMQVGELILASNEYFANPT